MKSKRSILIIEDSEEDQALYARFLHKRYEVYKAYTGEEGIAIFREKNIDCVLVDYYLPFFSGLEVLQELIKCDKPVALILLTGQGNEDLVVQALKNGAHDYLRKDKVTKLKIQEVIEETIEKVTKEFKRQINYQQKIQEIEEEQYRLLIIEYVRALRFSQEFPTKNIGQMCRKFAEDMKTAKQVTTLHLNTLNKLTHQFLPQEQQEFSVDARLLLVEMLGTLSDEYRLKLQREIK